MPIMKVRIFLPPLVCLVAGILLCGCSAPQSMPASTAPSPVATTAAPAQAPATMPGGFSLHVDEIVPGFMLPDAYTCKGAGESPELSWENVPKGN